MPYTIKIILIGILIITTSAAFVIASFSFPKYSDQIGNLVLILTLNVLVWYAYDTNRIANESVMQTELQTMPIMNIFVRFVSGVKNENEQRSISEHYAITHQINNGIKPSPYYFALRNTGSGPAFNIEVENENFVVIKYQTRFFAPLKDEHAFKIVRKPNNKIRSLSELQNEIFVVRCQSVVGKKYQYKFKVIDIEKRLVEFII